MPADGPTKRYLLRLYNANRKVETEALAERFAEAIKEHAGGEHPEIEIVDVLDDPERAITDEIFATPTLVKALPAPLRRVVGDLSDQRRVLLMLEVLVLEKPEAEDQS